MTDLKLKYNERQKNDYTVETKASRTKGIVNSDKSNITSNICFIEENGKKTFLNYSYLVRGVYEPDENQIMLYFTSCIISLKGIKLEFVFDDLISNDIKIIQAIDKRYKSVDTKEGSIVTEIVIKNID